MRTRVTCGICEGREVPATDCQSLIRDEDNKFVLDATCHGEKFHVEIPMDKLDRNGMNGIMLIDTDRVPTAQSVSDEGGAPIDP